MLNTLKPNLHIKKDIQPDPNLKRNNTMTLTHIDQLLTKSDCSLVTLSNWIDGEFISLINTGYGSYVNQLLNEISLGGAIGMAALEILLVEPHDFVGKGKTRNDSLNDLEGRLANLLQNSPDSIDIVFTAYDSFNMNLEAIGKAKTE